MTSRFRSKLALVAMATVGIAVTSVARADDAGPTPVPTVRVHVEAPNASLEVADGQNWVTVCEAPCDSELPLMTTYRLVSPDSTSASFRIGAKPGDRVALLAKPAAGARAAGGVTLIVVGGVSVVSGVFVVVRSNLGNIDVLSRTGRAEDHHYGGEVIAGLGVAAVVGGIVLVATSHPAAVDQHAPASTREGSQARTSPDRAPTWRALSEMERRAPRVTTVPIVSGTF